MNCAVILVFCLLGLNAGTETAKALFSELASRDTSAVRCDAIVADLCSRSFNDVGLLAAQNMTRFEKGFLPNWTTNKPWMKLSYPVHVRVRCASETIWYTVVAKASPGSIADVLVESAVGSGAVAERLLYLTELRHRHYSERTRGRLERIAKDHTQPAPIVLAATEILVQRADANVYFPDLLKACDRIENILDRSEQFRRVTDDLRGKMSLENQNRFLDYGFSLLRRINDGRSGRGYFLACHLGRFIGIPPVRDGQGEFTPDQRLPRYHTSVNDGALNELFFQETVDNALRWCHEHFHESTQEG